MSNKLLHSLALSAALFSPASHAVASGVQSTNNQVIAVLDQRSLPLDGVPIVEIIEIGDSRNPTPIAPSVVHSSSPEESNSTALSLLIGGGVALGGLGIGAFALKRKAKREAIADEELGDLDT